MADPILNVTFGDDTLNPGPALAEGKTKYNFTPSLCPGEGEYTIARNNRNCSTNGWKTILRDHTFLFNESALYGYMMLINSYAPSSSIYYTDTVQNLCANKTYLFSTAFGGLGGCSINDEALNILFRIETLSGQLIEYSYAGAPNLQSFQMLRYSSGFYFKLPAGESTAVIKIMNRVPDSHYCGNLLWIDDIQLRPIEGPKVTIAGGSGAFVTSLCFQQNATIFMTGVAEPLNVAVQWQQSVDSVTWQDIPGQRAYNYSRSFPVADTFLFRLRASDAAVIDNPNCSMVSNFIIVQVDGIPEAFEVSGNSPVCAGEPLKFNVQEGFAKYNWTGPNGFNDDVSYAEVSHSVLADSGMYYVEIETLGGCKAKDSIYATVIGTDVKAGPETAICLGNSVRLQASEGIKYSWSPAISLSDSVSLDPIASPDRTTTYTVKVTDTSGCTGSATVKIILKNAKKVVAKFSGPDFLCRPFDTATFYNASEGDLTNWHWDFNNGQTSPVKDTPQQSFYIGNKESYKIRLAVSDSAGCTDTAYHIINVANNCYIAVPTAFTPNGDGKNDFLYPVNAYKATDLVFRVYNRNGQLIFESRNWTNKWDGRVNGILEPTGVYVWSLDYNDPSRKKVSLKGTATLIR